MIDQVTLLIILNTLGSFPAMTSLEEGKVHGDHHHHHQTPVSIRNVRVIHSFSEGGWWRGGSDSDRSEPRARPRQQQIQIHRQATTQGHHSVCYRRKTWQHIFRQEATFLWWFNNEVHLRMVILFMSLNPSTNIHISATNEWSERNTSDSLTTPSRFRNITRSSYSHFRPRSFQTDVGMSEGKKRKMLITEFEGLWWRDRWHDRWRSLLLRRLRPLRADDLL